MISALTAEKIACARGGRMLFEGLSFQVRAGQALAVEGANGAGKTSLLRLIAGLLAPSAGEISLRLEKREVRDGEERGRFMGWMSHQDGIKPQLTVREQLGFFARLYRHPAPAGLAGLLEEVGLARQGDLACRYLSAGQKKRLALARLLASGRPVWLLDEPFASLDAAGQALVARRMALHCGTGGIVLAATHEPLGLGCGSIRL